MSIYYFVQYYLGKWMILMRNVVFQNQILILGRGLWLLGLHFDDLLLIISQRDFLLILHNWNISDDLQQMVETRDKNVSKIRWRQVKSIIFECCKHWRSLCCIILRVNVCNSCGHSGVLYQAQGSPRHASISPIQEEKWAGFCHTTNNRGINDDVSSKRQFTRSFRLYQLSITCARWE